MTRAVPALPPTFRALRALKDEAGLRTEFQTLTPANLPPGDAVVRVTHSSVNYKDGLAVAGRPGVLKSLPMTPGIDLAGEVVTDETGTYTPGTPVVLTGWGIGERQDGGYAEYARVRSEWLVAIPGELSAEWAMGVGTAGFTAMLAVLALEDHGMTPGQGEVLVTGAAGGVGSTAVALLAAAGFTVTASTGRPQEEAYLRSLGATNIIGREELPLLKRSLEKERWAGVVDTVGGEALAGAYASTRTHGSLAVCGLAGGHQLQTTVFPLILRGVNLLGIDSVTCPAPRRRTAWDRLARDLPPVKLAPLIRIHPLEDVPALAEEILAGQVRGRVVIKVASGTGQAP
ncbi:MDR family oxidoreductase [Deinococcus hopiensis]|uniref:Putative quinone oxidoreductase, YhdH/YhfP family n=1 Tax=Deinococcus hopiensis KR-140 TaxID=695939 RepID=A0A1W1VJG8_9DEIO|nr:MDR family oxidoreductase [Deinococcus hopiensis]SMB93466.1 putative quinone oxidoreductase, YhdH/YhfP family [Deinococcus hopiensis KR-140]